MRGFSALICTHNGAARLPATLRHAAALEVPAGSVLEVIVVDNASTDGTADVAVQSWSGPPEALRVIREPRLGRAYALGTGLRMVRFECIVIIDDDNWLPPNYLSVAGEILTGHPDVGIVGGDSLAAFDVDPPTWFARHPESFAIGSQGEAEGDITDSRGWVWGAGSVLRRDAVVALGGTGVEMVMTSRTGAKMATGDDIELCLYLRELGWRVWYSPRLRIQHYMPVARFRYRKFLSLTFQNGVLFSVVFHTFVSEAGPVRAVAGLVRGFLLRRLRAQAKPEVFLDLVNSAGRGYAFLVERRKIAIVRANRRKLLGARVAKAGR